MEIARLAYFSWFLSVFVGFGYFWVERNPDEVFYIYKVPTKKVEVGGIDILPRTLWTIAQKHGTTVHRIKKVNGLKTDMVAPGQKVIVPVPKKVNHLVSWYGPGFHGKKTADGKVFDQTDDSAVAHPTLPLGTKVKIGGIPAIVKDRGPYPHYLMAKLNVKYEARNFDASHGLAKKVGFDLKGVVSLPVEIVEIPGSFPTLEEARKSLG